MERQTKNKVEVRMGEIRRRYNALTNWHMRSADTLMRQLDELAKEIARCQDDIYKGEMQGRLWQS